MTFFDQTLEGAPGVGLGINRAVMELDPDSPVEELVPKVVDRERNVRAQTTHDLRNDDANRLNRRGGRRRFAQGAWIDPGAAAADRFYEQLAAQDLEGPPAGVAADVEDFGQFALAWNPLAPGVAQDIGADGVGHLRHQRVAFEDQGHRRVESAPGRRRGRFAPGRCNRMGVNPNRRAALVSRGRGIGKPSLPGRGIPSQFRE